MQSTLHIADRLVQQVTPVVVVPRFTPLAPLVRSGERYLVTGDGLMLEVSRPFIRMVVQISKSRVAMPFGELPASVEYRCGRLPLALLKRFEVEAQETPEVEIAAWITWNRLTGEWRYRRLEALSASGEHIEVVRPVLKDDECLVIDVHSHASLPAFFSSQDNRDDHAEVKLCAVFGLCNRAVTELRIRSVATQGLFYPLLNKAGLKELSLESLEDTGHALFLEAMNGPSD